jgi:hypothetical protein
VDGEKTENKPRSGARLHRSDTAIQRHVGGQEIETGRENRVQTQVQPVGAVILFARPNELNTRRACGGKSKAHASRDPQERRHEATRAVRSATDGAEFVGTKRRGRRTTRGMASGASGARTTERKHKHAAREAGPKEAPETGREEKEHDSEIEGAAARFGRRKQIKNRRRGLSKRSRSSHGARVVRKRDSGGGAIWDEKQKKSRESRNLAPSADQMKTETQHNEKNAHGGAHGGD